MARILRGLLADHPFFGSLALRMEMTPDTTRKTVASDGYSVRYNPEWVEENDAENIRLAVSYGVLACGLKHHLRRGDRQEEKWKTASYMVCLPILREAGFTTEEGGLDMSVERAYEMLPDLPPSDDQGGEGQGEGGGGGQPPPQAGNGEQDPNKDDGDGNGKGQDQSPSFDPQGHGEVMDSPKPEASDTQEQEESWDDAMHTARQWARAQGNLAGGVNELVNGTYESDIPWEQIVSRFLVEYSKTDYTWRKPNKKFEDIYLPSLFNQALGPVGFFVDTSGSLNHEALGHLWGEMKNVVQLVRPSKVLVIQADAAVHAIDEYEPEDMPESLDAKGRGGTDFRPAFKALEEQQTTPVCVLYFTDGMCSDFPEDPGVPVLWVIDRTNRYSRSKEFNPPFGEIVYMGGS